MNITGAQLKRLLRKGGVPAVFVAVVSGAGKWIVEKDTEIRVLQDRLLATQNQAAEDRMKLTRYASWLHWRIDVLRNSAGLPPEQTPDFTK